MVTTSQPISQPAMSELATAAVTEQHSLRATIAYHLLPGVLILAVALATMPLVTAAGFPPLAAMAVAILVAQLPVQLGHLLRLGWRRNGRLSLAGVVLYRRRLPRWQYPLWGLGIVVWGIIVALPLQPVSAAMLKTVFAWVPSGFTATSGSDAAAYSGYSRTILLITFGGMLVLNGLAAPIVEELYFRGYLLPRLSRLGGKAPLLQTLLFTLYHFWQPWLYPTLLLTVAGFIFPVSRLRSISVGIWGHCAMNLIGGLAMLTLIFS
jgi:CAAX protease family protein